MSTVGIVIVAGGSGTRMGAALPKQFIELGGEAILMRTLRAFAAALPDAPVVVVLPEEHIALWQDICGKTNVVPRHDVVCGGATRFESVKNGVAAMPRVDLIAVHDGVRPFASRELILRVVAKAQQYGAAIPVVEPSDSFRTIDAEASTPVDRSALRAVQTPQVFRADILRLAYSMPYDPSFTDDATLVERAGGRVRLCTGEVQNIKITTPLDIIVGRAIIESYEEKI